MPSKHQTVTTHASRIQRRFTGAWFLNTSLTRAPLSAMALLLYRTASRMDDRACFRSRGLPLLSCSNADETGLLTSSAPTKLPLDRVGFDGCEFMLSCAVITSSSAASGVDSDELRMDDLSVQQHCGTFCVWASDLQAHSMQTAKLHRLFEEV